LTCTEMCKRLYCESNIVKIDCPCLTCLVFSMCRGRCFKWYEDAKTVDKEIYDSFKDSCRY